MFFWLLLAAAAAMGGEQENIPATRRLQPIPAQRRLRLRATSAGPTGPGIKLWGSDQYDNSATWRPFYIKSRGCKKFRWGMCLREHIDGLREHPNAPQRVEDFEKWAIKILRIFYGDEVDIAEWLVENACARFSFPLRAYEDQWGAVGYAVDVRDGSGLNAAAPPSPLPPRDGWDRAWFSWGDNVLRNERTPTIFWPAGEGPGPTIKDVAGQDVLRALLRMDVNETGAVDAAFLRRDKIRCDKDHKWLARRSIALGENK